MQGMYKEHRVEEQQNVKYDKVIHRVRNLAPTCCMRISGRRAASRA